MSISRTESGPQDGNQPRWIAVAHILRPQGRKGEVLAELLTDFPERFEARSRVFLAPPEFQGAVDDARAAEVLSFWLPVGRNEGRIVLHLQGVETISAAECLAGLDVLIPAAERAPLEDDAAYISDLVGCVLYDMAVPGDPVEVGTVRDVEFAMTPDGARRLEDAAPLLSVEARDGAEVLVPFVKEFLITLDPAGRRIEMSLPPGLLDVNRA